MEWFKRSVDVKIFSMKSNLIMWNLPYFFKQLKKDIVCKFTGHDVPCGTFMLCQKCYRSIGIKKCCACKIDMFEDDYVRYKTQYYHIECFGKTKPNETF